MTGCIDKKKNRQISPDPRTTFDTGDSPGMQVHHDIQHFTRLRGLSLGTCNFQVNLPAFEAFFTSLNSSNTAPTIGIIMAVVAVLLTHIDKNHVGSINPNISLQNIIFKIILSHMFLNLKYLY